MDEWRKSSFSDGMNCVEICWRKSSYSSSSGNCVEVGLPKNWQKSSFSAAGACVEVANNQSTVLIRNSNHPERGTLAFPTTAMYSWIEGIKHGDLG